MFSLKSHDRLKSKKDIELLFNEGKQAYFFPFKLMYILRDLDEDRVPLKFAISVPKKKLKKAVDRNLIKRRCREAYRLNNSALKDLLTSHNKQLILMFIYLNHEIKEYITIEKSIKKHLNALLSEISA